MLWGTDCVQCIEMVLSKLDHGISKLTLNKQWSVLLKYLSVGGGRKKKS